MTKQKVLVLDIETAPMTVYAWGRKDINVALNQIQKEWSIIAWSAKWLGEKKVWYMDQRNSGDVEDDKFILEFLWQLLDKADIVITQNGQRFDCPKLNARFILHGFPPPSPYRHLDTYQIARKIGFTSHKLEYLTDKLCKKYKKLSHTKFPGMSLWNECLKGNRKAWKEMERYNKHDVLSTEELYMKLRAWVPANAPKVYPGRECESCGKGPVINSGFYISKKGKFQRLKCKSCAIWTLGG